MKWINLLHFYQPPNSTWLEIKEALDKSYLRLIKLMEDNPKLKMTWNVAGCLLQRLKDEGELDFISRLKALIKNGQVELVSSAAYHGLLPLLPKGEVIRQVEENELITKNVLGVSKTSGFFLPEMAYSPEIAKIIKSLGYKWVVLDEVAVAENKEIDLNKVCVDKHSGLKVVFRNRMLSTAYPPSILKEKNLYSDLGELAITATDAELYGLRHLDPALELEKLISSQKIKTSTVSEFISESELANKEQTEVNLFASSWDSSLEDIKRGQAFNLWQDKNNPIHKQLWNLSYFALSLGDKFKEDDNYTWYRWHLVRGLASCTFWWASANDFSRVFGPYAWSPDVVERGLEDLIRSVRSIDSEKSRSDKLKAEKYYIKTKQLIWQCHWKKHWRKPVSED